MALYKIDKKLEYIKNVTFKYEKEIQKLTEENLNSLLGLDFIKSEFSLNNFRIDTLAFDNETNICDIELQRKGLKIIVNLKNGELQDSRKIARDVSNIGHLGNVRMK